MNVADLIDPVTTAMQETAATAIQPRFECLAQGDVEEKSPGELVTVADREAEALLTRRLEQILPGAPVVGEEASATDPRRRRALDAELVWVVDPLDGTANFVAGSPDWAVMVALLAEGVTVGSWMWLPVRGRMYVAERGAGAYRDGERLRTEPRAGEEASTRGAVLSRFLDPETRARVAHNGERFGSITSGRLCAGVEYPEVAEGGQDFVLFWRTLPWDHAPGVLFIEEAGGVARRPDGAAYRPAIDGVGLVVAADQRTWDLARRLLD